MRSLFSEICNELIDELYSDEVASVGDSLKIDLKGANKKDVSVTVSGHKITVTSTKKNVHDQLTKYNKTFVLNKAYDPSTITAKYEDSILTISAELGGEFKPREITIA